MLKQHHCISPPQMTCWGRSFYFWAKENAALPAEVKQEWGQSAWHGYVASLCIVWHYDKHSQLMRNACATEFALGVMSDLNATCINSTYITYITYIT